MKPPEPVGSTGTDADNLELVQFSEDALAVEFGDRYAVDTRFIAQAGRWMNYDGDAWREDRELRAFTRARGVCRDAASRCNEPRERKLLTASRTVAAVEKMARADRRTIAVPEQWDADPWLLNTPDRIVDLHTGEMRKHDDLGLDYLTKLTGVTPDSQCQIPTWLRFLDRVTASDTALQSYLQRVAGYTLTGDTSEHALFFFFGTGGNGKGVLFNVLTGIAGEYSRVAPIETFTESKNDRHPTELAGLRGARLVTATETEQGRAWSETKIKTLTGGDSISARLMHQNFSDFVPQFKLVISGNHLPKLRSVDEAMRRRLHLIPFTVTIPEQERDLELSDKLKAEWPGILAWAVQGCLQWQEKGLAKPPAVRNATATYLASEDVVAAWLEECCTLEPGNLQAFEKTSDLFASWREWVVKSGEQCGTRSDFCEAIERYGAIAHRKEHGRGYDGVRLKHR
jgi:putative DNA primase/helicase